MKTLRLNKLASITGLAVGVAFLVSLTSAIVAEEPVFKGGAQKLLNPPARTAVVSESKLMACPKCTTELVARPIVTTKAAAPKTEMVARHLCATCETVFKVEGHGKAKHDVAVHKCNSCGATALACCSTSATK